jgi:hypothetical protein
LPAITLALVRQVLTVWIAHSSDRDSWTLLLWDAHDHGLAYHRAVMDAGRDCMYDAIHTHDVNPDHTV